MTQPIIPPLTPRPDVTSDQLTSWYPGKVKPARVGEYNASQFQNVATLRWWNGFSWSYMYFHGEPENLKAKARSQVELTKLQDQILWRGLAYDPSDAANSVGQSQTGVVHPQADA